MAGVVRPVAWGESAQELYEWYRAERDVGRRKRLHALWLVRRGEHVDAAARQVGVGRRTLTRWLGWYRQGGLAAVLARVPGHGAVGSAGRLSAEQQRALLARAAEGAFRTYEEARRRVLAEYGVDYSYQGMYAVLARLGVHPKVPRPTAAKADPAAREAWKGGGSPRR
ncbi:MAG TPA: winged helix-turn-helix domain-containing protein [Vicinamibacteria bacterium]|nr:winged helix-turn-helix domain-containing protein [Vicinamibacteria bacterium]